MKYLRFKEEIINKYTDNFSFREIVYADFFPYLKANKNEVFNKFLLTETSQKEEDVKLIIDNKIKENKKLNKEITISIVEKETGKWVGFLTCYDYGKTIAASLMIGPEYWGTGVAKEIAKSATQIFLNHSGFNEVVVRIFKGNEKSIHLNYAMGAKFVEEKQLLNAKNEVREYSVLVFKEITDEVEVNNIV